VEDEYLRKHHDARGEAILDLMKNVPCHHCHGYRLKPDLLEYTVNGLHIGQLTALSADEAMEWFSGDFAGSFSRSIEKQAAASLQERILERLEAMQKAGLGYISTDRIVGTLSGGEFQRLQLAGLVRAPLTGVAYILDEPSFGLHPKDILRISDLIRTLNEHGNTIIMVDHSPLLTGQSDYTLELGPGAGSKGGHIVFAGNTRDYPTQKQQIPAPVHAGTISREGMSIHKAHANNLQDLDVDIRAGVMTTITGVSGSGKTSLLDKVIYESFRAQKPVFCADFQGFANFSGLIYIEQTAAVSGSDASVGNMLGLSTVLACIFAASAESKKRGFKSAHFLKGAREGRCTGCEGSGIQTVSMDFFTDIVTTCERCGGTAFRDEILELRVDGKTISDNLHIPFDELAGFLAEYMPAKSDKTVKSTLELIQKTGLGHLSCGRSLKTVSGGEWQRLKLVSGLASKTEKNTLILLDEPTAGLHPKDIERLLLLFQDLLNEGNTLVCVTHEPLLMAAASASIELGPGGGTQGGRIGKWN
jgi:excinuclease ABC subunit A